MRVIKQIGNKDLLKREKTLFICSKRTPIQFYENVFQWTDSLSARDCIACFNSTELEEEVLKTLLVDKIPTILFVMNRFTYENNVQITQALEENRMLVVVLRRDEPRGKGPTPRLRNEFVISKCESIVCGYVNKNGTIFGLLAGRDNVDYLIKDDSFKVVAETDNSKFRWTVGEDKTLLRMFYEDKGIHAIHKQLHRSYPAIYTRIRSITLPEEVLKGREFEDYILELFNLRGDSSFILKEWQGDKTLGDIYPENNRHPDFVLDYQGKGFSIECKWREKLSLDLERDIFSQDKMAIYQKFSAERGIPVFIVLGVGGEPSNPEYLYNIPLPEVESVLSHPKTIIEYLRPSPEIPFNITDFISVDSQNHQKAYTMKKKSVKCPNA